MFDASFDAKTDKDGKLHLDLDTGEPNSEVKVTVRVRPRKSRAEWIAFVERTAGSIDDPTFMRQPQGDTPPPVSWDDISS